MADILKFVPLELVNGGSPIMINHDFVLSLGHSAYDPQRSALLVTADSGYTIYAGRRGNKESQRAQNLQNYVNDPIAFGMRRRRDRNFLQVGTDYEIQIT